MIWREVKRCDPAAREIADRHYSRQTPGAQEFMPPGETLVLYVPGAVWGSSRNIFLGRVRLRCCIFRNETKLLSSTLIARATALTYRRWPSERLTTEVKLESVRSKRDPGYAFRCAGWVTLGRGRHRRKGGGTLVYLAAPPPAALDERGELV
jgi:hypothetical protein